jgi:hypothetical protein
LRSEGRAARRETRSRLYRLQPACPLLRRRCYAETVFVGRLHRPVSVSVFEWDASWQRRCRRGSSNSRRSPSPTRSQALRRPCGPCFAPASGGFNDADWFGVRQTPNRRCHNRHNDRACTLVECRTLGLPSPIPWADRTVCRRAARVAVRRSPFVARDVCGARLTSSNQLCSSSRKATRGFYGAPSPSFGQPRRNQSTRTCACRACARSQSDWLGIGPLNPQSRSRCDFN